MAQAITFGVDTAKYVFEVHGRDAAGNVVVRRSIRRHKFLEFFAKQPRATIGMEACSAAHHWGRQLRAMGHDVKLMPPTRVKPYVVRNKNDRRDAEACCEAVTRPTMQFVPIKTVEQQASLMLHSDRELLVGQRTQLSNHLRSALTEFGIVTPHGKEGLKHLVAGLREDKLPIPATARRTLLRLAGRLDELEAAIREVTHDIEREAKADPRTKMLCTAPGVGLLTAHAILALMPDPSLFTCGRNVAAWVGLTQRQDSTGGKTRLGPITKKGNRMLRRLLVLGATALIRHVRLNLEKGSPWLQRMIAANKPMKLIAVAQAARTARILWAMLRDNQPYRRPGLQAAACSTAAG
jgi:transposase